MRKKFLSAFLLGALTLAATSTFVSCKDYDDDISSLNDKIANLDKSLSDKLNAVQQQLTAQKQELETKIASAQTALQSAIDTKEDKTVVAALAARVTELETAKAACEARLATIEGDIATLKSDVAAKAGQADLDAAVLKINGDIAAVTGDVADLQALVETLATKAELQDAIDAYAAADSKLADQFAADLAAAKVAQGVKDGEQDAALTAAVAKLNTAIADAVKALSDGQVKANADAIADLQAAAAQIAPQMDALKTADANMRTDIDAINTKIADYPTVKAALEQAKKDIENLKTATGQSALDMAEKVSKNAEGITGLKNTLEAATAKFNTDLNAAIAKANETFQTKAEAAEQFAAISNDVNTLTVFVTKRLTSIYFCPTTYVDGVECISFNSISFTNWGDAIDVCPTGKKIETVTIGDGSKLTTADYILNPSGVGADGIETLSFVSNKAENIKTKAAETSPITVANANYDSIPGRVVLTLQKNEGVDFGDSNAKFTIVSLKATLAELVKTAEEKGKEINVYSDWARVKETKKTPYIHNAKCWDVQKNVPVCKADTAGIDKYPHLLAFSDIYKSTAKADTTAACKIKAIYKNADRPDWRIRCSYDKTVDLAEYAKVCDKEGNEMDAEKIGLHFEYALMDTYYVQNENQTKDATNQQTYAKIDGSVVSAKGLNKEEANAVCEGKTPVAQIKLMYGTKVVDVKYVMIEWGAEAIEMETVATVKGEANFECGGKYGVWFNETALNGIAEIIGTNANEQMAKKLDFSGTDNGQYTIAKNIKIYGADGKQLPGGSYVAIYYPDTQTGQTFNMQLRIMSSANIVSIDDVYEAGSKVCKLTVVIPDLLGRDWIKIPVELTVKFDAKKQMGYGAYTKNTENWKDAGKTVVASPTMIKGVNYNKADDYTNTQLRYNLLDSYRDSTKAAPKSVAALVKGATSVKFDIDTVAVRSMYANLETKDAKFHMSEDGNYLMLGSEYVAVRYEGTGMVALWDGWSYEAGKDAAKASVTAIKILNSKKGLPVKLTGTFCGKTVTIDEFVVKFEIPLAISAPGASDAIDDQAGEVSSKAVAWDNVLDIRECFGPNKGVVYGKELAGKEKNDDLAKWYVVTEPKLDIANATLDGAKLSSYVNSNGKALYELSSETTVYNYDTAKKKLLSDRGFVVKFKYNGTNALVNDLKIEIPFKVSTKWSGENSYTFTLTIKHHDTSAKRK